MKIQFLNHSSYILSHHKFQLLVDPWFSGKVFNNGWSLINSTEFDISNYEKITHIYISHEHPDHFHPPTINSIPIKLRGEITIIFPKTNDKRVVGYLLEKGFTKVIEIDKRTPIKINDNIEIYGDLYGEFDSWLYVKIDNYGILNTNDCPIRNKSQIDKVKESIKYNSVDILLTQFSYAKWIGNPDEKILREKDSLEKLELIKFQVEQFDAKYIIPIASFIWFSARENFYLNDSINTPNITHEYIEKNIKCTPVILFYGDIFDSNWQPNFNKKAISKFEAAYSNIKFENTTSNPSVDLDIITIEANKFIKQMKSKYPKYILFFLKPVNIYLTDIEKIINFSINKGIQSSNTNANHCDAHLQSDSFYFCLSQPYGIDALGINGRYRTTSLGSFSKFYNIFRLNLLSVRGTEITFNYLIHVFIRKFIKLFSKIY